MTSGPLSRELQARLGADALILAPSSRKKASLAASSEPKKPSKGLSKKQRKRLAQLEYKRATEGKSMVIVFDFLVKSICVFLIFAQRHVLNSSLRWNPNDWTRARSPHCIPLCTDNNKYIRFLSKFKLFF
jgi:hypothetical protein